MSLPTSLFYFFRDALYSILQSSLIEYNYHSKRIYIDLFYSFKKYIDICIYLTFIVNFFQFLVLFPSCRLLSSFFCFRNINCGQSSFFPILCDFSVCWWTDFTGGLTGVTQRNSPSESFFKVFQEVILVPYRLVLLSKNPLSC